MNTSTQRNTPIASRGDSPKSITEAPNFRGEGGERQDWQDFTETLPGLLVRELPIPVERAEVNVSELVLDARCEMAMARVQGPFDFRSSFEHCRRARRCAYRAGAASLCDATPPLQFLDSPTLLGAWQAGREARQRELRRLN